MWSLLSRDISAKVTLCVTCSWSIHSRGLQNHSCSYRQILNKRWLGRGLVCVPAFTPFGLLSLVYFLGARIPGDERTISLVHSADLPSLCHLRFVMLSH